MIKPIRYSSEDDSVLRDGLIFTLFSKAPLDEVTKSFRDIMDLWLSIVPKEELVWYHTKDTFKPVKKNTISRLKGLLKTEKITISELIGFLLFSHPKDNPDYLLDVICSTHGSNDRKPKTNFIEMRFPTDFLINYGVEAFVMFCLNACSQMTFDSGYASIGLNGFADQGRFGWSFAREYAFQHPGFDLSDNRPTSHRIDRQSRGARWLTFLGDEPLTQLGGSDTLQTKLGSGITVFPAGKGVMLRAGEYPDVGDLENGNNLPLLRSVAKAIEPVTFFGDTYLRALFDENRDPEPAARWERRFLD